MDSYEEKLFVLNRDGWDKLWMNPLQILKTDIFFALYQIICLDKKICTEKFTNTTGIINMALWNLSLLSNQIFSKIQQIL